MIALHFCSPASELVAVRARRHTDRAVHSLRQREAARGAAHEGGVRQHDRPRGRVCQRDRRPCLNAL